MRKKNVRLGLNGHAAVHGDRVEGAREAVLHIVLEIDAAGRASGVVVTVGAAHVAGGRAGREACVAVGSATARERAVGVVAVRRRHGVLSVRGIVVMMALSGHANGQRIAGRGELA